MRDGKRDGNEAIQEKKEKGKEKDATRVGRHSQSTGHSRHTGLDSDHAAEAILRCYVGVAIAGAKKGTSRGITMWYGGYRERMR